jgi:hypothetical protein
MLFSTDWTLVAHDEMSASGHELNSGDRKECGRPYLNSDVRENEEATITGGGSAICG